ncbi:RNA polymerase subunit sigma-70 [Mycobacterium sp. 852002-50816_SCH5313054-b]|uniref:RNA polymerase subunit sigma-70 n=1 Tax=Mycobacterium sp. 852002-50816_SCH5313054-b TaxID=1834092 RepID=UPI000801E42B|nr:RNA polymerase subunit sigma-70 [Mycobacterium sp. 852002-50816_SCH5313054-b]OBF44715.1 RNA polymerase subunit sigma-70 [Mycobacterium sp. 852002-50816_SCH5313054-b]
MPTTTETSEDFGRLAEPFRRELIAYGYRMLGSLDDAEEIVQDVYLEAWRAYDRFEGRSSLRTWLYRIATRAFIKGIERHHRRPLPSDLSDPAMDAFVAVQPGSAELAWLQPAPDSVLTGALADPAAVVTARHTARLAFIAALQVLTPRQRAVLILRDVLSLSAAEVAAVLDLSVAAVNSALQRARSRLPADHDTVVEPSQTRERELLDRYVAAFENADVTGLMAVLTEDAMFEMPPVVTWFRGADDVGGFLGARMRELGKASIIRISANWQPAVALYVGPGGKRRLHSLQVLTVAPQGISRIVSFMDRGALRAFDLPEAHS